MFIKIEKLLIYKMLKNFFDKKGEIYLNCTHQIKYFFTVFKKLFGKLLPKTNGYNYIYFFKLIFKEI